jgi:hypothetical protein
MLERPEAAGVAFGTGVIIVVVGVIGVSTSDAVNIGFIVAGVVIAVLAAGWWQLLRRANR